MPGGMPGVSSSMNFLCVLRVLCERTLFLRPAAHLRSRLRLRRASLFRRGLIYQRLRSFVFAPRTPRTQRNRRRILAFVCRARFAGWMVVSHGPESVRPWDQSRCCYAGQTSELRRNFADRPGCVRTRGISESHSLFPWFILFAVLDVARGQAGGSDKSLESRTNKVIAGCRWGCVDRSSISE
jgi:hypothetical protein